MLTLFCGIGHAKPFNRTSMELKHVECSLQNAIYIAFNRTSMELKPASDLRTAGGYIAFNRTSMELKPLRACVSQKLPAILLIEPVWN